MQKKSRRFSIILTKAISKATKILNLAKTSTMEGRTQLKKNWEIRRKKSRLHLRKKRKTSKRNQLRNQ
jgi:hypothetical protein